MNFASIPVVCIFYTVLDIFWSQVPLSQQTLRSIECSSLRDDEYKVILKDVSVTVKCGQMLAILGGSGSGKTTLLDVIANRHENGFVEGEVNFYNFYFCS